MSKARDNQKSMFKYFPKFIIRKYQLLYYELGKEIEGVGLGGKEIQPY